MVAKRGPKKGYKQTPEHITNRRIALTGKSLSEMGHKPDCTCCICKAKRGERKGENHPSYGVPRTVEDIRKMSIGQTKSHENDPERRENQREYKIGWHEENPNFFRGENNPNWKDGAGNFPYPFEFNKKLIFYIRDKNNNVCQLCGKTKEENGENLSVHHINYDKDDLFELNFTALCRSCNSIVNFNCDMYEDYFTFQLLNGIVS